MARTPVLVALAVLGASASASTSAAVGSRYALANRCFAISSSGASIAIAGPDSYRAGASRAAAGRFFLKPTGLGTYLVGDTDGRLLSVTSGEQTGRASGPGPAAEWAAQTAGGRVALRSTANRRLLAVAPGGALVTVQARRPGSRERFGFVVRRGCRAYPEAQIGATGRPFRGTRRDRTVFGFADAHVHITADLRAGGQTLYGENFDRFGITEALGHDADEHGPDGSLDATGNLLRAGKSTGTHDTHGWPSFTGWPTYDTYTHQQIYYRWLQRAWMAGMRLAVAQVVEDEPLCTIEPRRSHSCDETATIRLEVQRLRALQDYVDAQSGGPGRGWLRLVYDPGQARRAIERGKLAMLIGVESSNPFGCSERNGQPECDRADVDKGLVLYHHLGIRAMFITHWVDNAFGGAALEGGNKGALIGAFNVEQTGNPFMAGPCPEPGQGEEVPPLPGPQCNTRRLTDLGRYLIGKLMDDHMLIEADHLSEQTRLDVFELAEARHYPLVSSHNGTGGFWTPEDLRRLHALGGYVSATPGAAGTLGGKILGLGRYGFSGVGLGTDTGGFAAFPGPDPEAGKNPLRYPFRSFDGRVSFARERTGTRVFDLNKDGVAHYGLLPDLLADMQRRKNGRRALGALFRSAEAYLRTWQLAVGS